MQYWIRTETKDGKRFADIVFYEFEKALEHYKKCINLGYYVTMSYTE